MKQYPFLFSIDLEDILFRFPDGQRPNAESSVVETTSQILDFLDHESVRITFFVCGDVINAYPFLLKRIHDSGHEIACHTFSHTPLNHLSPKSFAADIERFLKAYEDLGLNQTIKGFRAPIFSLTPETSWAYQVLADYGFMYSSSVLPASNPQYGWENFDQKPKMLNGIWELPISVAKYGPIELPLVGGTYLRWLPFGLINWKIKQALHHQVVTSFLHPYDIDTKQSFFKHPGINSLLFNILLYFKRSSCLSKMKKLVKTYKCNVTYMEYISSLEEQDQISRERAA